jgi:nucleotidyltransferase/DNA polymerase involved in DNA repair
MSEGATGRTERPAPTLGGPPPRPTAAPEWVLYVDLDAYYVACELRERPDLVGMPVIVGVAPGTEPSRGVVLSASYEARTFGVHSAMPVATAARLCPNAAWIAPDFRKYERISDEVRALLRPLAERVIPYSIDECVLVPRTASASAAVDLARQVQRELKARLGLGASVGVAASRVVAKIASDRAKPGGVILVRPEEVASFLAPLPVRAIPGVGPKTEELLASHDVHTVGDLASRRASDLVRDLGGFARELVALARGSPTDEVGSEQGRRSRSADSTFDRDAIEFDQVEPVVRRLAQEVASGLTEEGLRYGAVSVGFRWADFERSQRGRALPASQEGPESLTEEAVHLARGLWGSERSGADRAVRTVSVRAERLSPRTQRQVSLDDFGRRRGGRSG